MTRKRNALEVWPPLVKLSRRELQVLECRAAGMSYKIAAVKLGLSTHTVREYIRRILAKTGAKSSLEAVGVVLVEKWRH